MQAGKGQDTVTQQEVPSNILPDPKAEVLKPQEVFAAGGQKGAGAVTIGMTGESELVTEAHPATVPTDGSWGKEVRMPPQFPCSAWGLETGAGWEGPGLFTLSTGNSPQP